MAIKRADEHDQEVEDSRADNRHSPSATDAHRWLLTYLGKKKSFDDVYDFVDVVQEHIKREKCKLPEFEILPNYKPGQINLQEKKQKRAKTPARPAGVVKRSKKRNSISARSDPLSKAIATPNRTSIPIPRSIHRTIEPRSGRGSIPHARNRNDNTAPTRRLVRRADRNTI